MIDLSKVLVDIARCIVDHPDEVKVTEETDDENINLVLSVAESDMGMIIGRHGRIAKAIRVVMKSAAKSTNKKVTVEIK